jgi:hypothetical protein
MGIEREEKYRAPASAMERMTTQIDCSAILTFRFRRTRRAFFAQSVDANQAAIGVSRYPQGCLLGERARLRKRMATNVPRTALDHGSLSVCMPGECFAVDDLASRCFNQSCINSISDCWSVMISCASLRICGSWPYNN